MIIEVVEAYPSFLIVLVGIDEKNEHKFDYYIIDSFRNDKLYLSYCNCLSYPIQTTTPTSMKYLRLASLEGRSFVCKVKDCWLVLWRGWPVTFLCGLGKALIFFIKCDSVINNRFKLILEVIRWGQPASIVFSLSTNPRNQTTLSPKNKINPLIRTVGWPNLATQRKIKMNLCAEEAATSRFNLTPQ